MHNFITEPNPAIHDFTAPNPAIGPHSVLSTAARDILQGIDPSNTPPSSPVAHTLVGDASRPGLTIDDTGSTTHDAVYTNGDHRDIIAGNGETDIYGGTPGHPTPTTGNTIWTSGGSLWDVTTGNNGIFATGYADVHANGNDNITVTGMAGATVHAGTGVGTGGNNTIDVSASGHVDLWGSGGDGHTTFSFDSAAAWGVNGVPANSVIHNFSLSNDTLDFPDYFGRNDLTSHMHTIAMDGGVVGTQIDLGDPGHHTVDVVGVTAQQLTDYGHLLTS